jgi:hypothetical protein
MLLLHLTLIFIAFSLPPSVTETIFTLPQFSQKKLLYYLNLFSRYFKYTSPLGENNVLLTLHIKIVLLVYCIFM